jgi:hypothetical protein
MTARAAEHAGSVDKHPSRALHRAPKREDHAHSCDSSQHKGFAGTPRGTQTPNLLIRRKTLSVLGDSYVANWLDSLAPPRGSGMIPRRNLIHPSVSRVSSFELRGQAFVSKHRVPRLYRAPLCIRLPREPQEDIFLGFGNLVGVRIPERCHWGKGRQRRYLVYQQGLLPSDHARGIRPDRCQPRSQPSTNRCIGSILLYSSAPTSSACGGPYAFNQTNRALVGGVPPS